MTMTSGATSRECRERQGICDPHVHTRCSDGRDDPEDVVEYADRLGWLDVLAVTDHDTVEGALRARAHAARLKVRLSVIVGEEVSTRDGHVVALFISQAIPSGLTAAETVVAIHEAGGIAIAPHPYWHPGRYGVADLATELAFDAVEVLNGSPAPSTVVANRRAARRCVDSRARCGGSDAHLKEAVATCGTAFPGKDPEAFRRGIESGLTTPVRCRQPGPRYAVRTLRTIVERPASLRHLWPFS